MVINIVSPHASHYLGGMEVVTIHMARHLARNGDTIRFFTRRSGRHSDVFQNFVDEQADNVEIVEIPTPPLTPLPDTTWATFYKISCDFGIAAQPYYSKYNDADLFVTHLSVDSLFVPKNSRTILHLHGSPDQVDPLMEAAVQVPVTIIAHAYSIKQWWGKHFPQLSPLVFQNGIDTTFYNGEPAVDRPIDILYVGRLMDHKGIDDILYAVNSTQTVVVAGNGPYINTVHEIVNERGLQDSVTIHDSPSTDTIRKLYRQAKIFACPSRGREGVLTTLLEAGASGCAVVTASGSGMTDLVQNNVNGIVIPPGNVLELSDALNTLLSNPKKRQTLAATLQTELIRNWSWDSKIIELKDLYNALV